MKIIKMQESSLKDVYSGVYKITFPNNKVYIGISNNMYRRMLEHNTDFRNNLPIEHAIQKYGPITEFEILELIKPEDKCKMREREKYWINYFNANHKDFGYNVSEGGDGAESGSLNHEAKFTEEEILVIYDELQNNLELSLQDIATKYGIHMTTISHINNGKTYYHSHINYPLRNSKQCKKIISGLNNRNSYLTEEMLNNIYHELLYNQDISMKQIANKYQVSPTIIQNINIGKTYYNDIYNYPLRQPKTGARKLSPEQVQNIIQKIKTETKKSLSQIAREIGVSSKTVSSINCGTVYKQKEEIYPIRKKQ